MAKLKELQQELSELHKKEAEVKKKIATAKKDKMIQCLSCKRRTKVSSLTYIQTYWYERPYSCTGGDNWWPGEGQFDCPKCGANNRLLEGPDYMKGSSIYRPEVVALKPYFKEVVKKYDR